MNLFVQCACKIGIVVDIQEYVLFPKLHCYVQDALVVNVSRYDSIHTADGGARRTRISAGYEVWMLGWPLDPVILIATLMSDQSGKKENDIRHIGDQDQNDDHGDEHGENLLDNPSYGCAGYARYDEQQHPEWWCG